MKKQKAFEPRPFYTLNVYEKIDALLKQGVFYVQDSDATIFLDHVKAFAEATRLNPDSFIASTIYLQINRNISREILNVIINQLFKKPLPSTLPAIDLISKYELLLMGSINDYTHKKIIEKLIKKTTKNINDVVRFSKHIYFKANFNLTQDTLLELIHHYYTDYIFIGESEDEALNEIREDAITHIQIPKKSREINHYTSAYDFLVVFDLLTFLGKMKNELKKLNHVETVKENIYDSTWSVENVRNDYNMFPMVFKDANSCELFKFLIGTINNPKEADFFYYFVVFQEEKLLNKKLKVNRPKVYTDFVNGLYGKSMKRLRNSTYTQKMYFKRLNYYKEIKIEFDKKTTSKTN